MANPTTPPRVERHLLATAWLGLALIMVGGSAIWWRNHDILSDLYDYSSVMAAAGKIEGGLKPYVDFRSTMQSATYLLNYGAELGFGRNYRGLTLGGLLFSLLGTGALFLVLKRACGVGGGLLLTAAVAWSGLGQHVVVFYNTIGILCFTVVVAGVAVVPKLWGPPTVERILVLTALVLGGINKINFQFHGLALASVLVMQAGVAGRLNIRETRQSLLVLGVAGCLAPFLLELLWTGASPALWYQNVVGLAGERLEYCARLAEPAVWLGPPHDFHHHIPFKWLTASGLGLIVLVGGLAMQVIWRTKAQAEIKLVRLALVVVYAAGAVVGGLLLAITNVETIALTSLAFLVAAAGLWIAVGHPGEPGRRAAWSWLVPAAGLFWAVNGGVAAWQGSRVLYARADGERSVFVRLVEAPPALKYLEGTRLDADLHRTLLLTARELEAADGKSAGMKGTLFGPAFEWLERAYPETVIPGMPVWYHVGTSLRAEDGEWLIDQTRSHGVRRILVHPGWELWPTGFKHHLDQAYRPVSLGAVGLLREKLGEENAASAAGSFLSGEPLAMIERAGCNLHLLGSPPPEGFAFSSSPWGDYLGGHGSWQWAWSQGLSIVEGTVVVKRNGPSDAPAVVAVSAIEASAGTGAAPFWQSSITVGPGQQWARVPFRVTPYGKPVRLVVEPQTGEPASWMIGCRDLQVRQTTDSDEEPPPTAVAGLLRRVESGQAGKSFWLRSAAPAGADRLSWQTAPAEVWSRIDKATGSWRVTLETGTASDVGPGNLPVAMLLWYRSGRLELLSQQAIQPGDNKEVTFEGWMPEPGGWVGVAFRPMERGRPFSLPVRVKSLTF